MKISLTELTNNNTGLTICSKIASSAFNELQNYRKSKLGHIFETFGFNEDTLTKYWQAPYFKIAIVFSADFNDSNTATVKFRTNLDVIYVELL